MMTQNGRLWAAVKADHAPGIFAAVGDGADVNHNSRDHGWSPLHYAAYNGKVNSIKALLSCGADVHRRDHGWTPLHHASNNGYADVVRLLVAGGATVDAVSSHNQTPLHIASVFGHVDVVHVLLANGADVDAVDGIGSMPLHSASFMGHVHVVEMLLGRDANPLRVDRIGAMPVDRVCSSSNLDQSVKHVITWLLRSAMAWRRRSAAVAACALGLWEEEW
jgi:ankyrin repeat protein